MNIRHTFWALCGNGVLLDDYRIWNQWIFCISSMIKNTQQEKGLRLSVPACWCVICFGRCWMLLMVNVLCLYILCIYIHRMWHGLLLMQLIDLSFMDRFPKFSILVEIVNWNTNNSDLSSNIGCLKVILKNTQILFA